MKKLFSVLAAFLICAAIVLPAAAGTLDALSYRSAPHLIVHMEDVSKTLSRLGDSFMFEMLLDENPMIDNYYEQAGEASPDAKKLVQAAQGGFIEWVKNFPVESFSIVRGLMDEDEDTFHGAVHFSPQKQEVLSRISALDADEDDAEGKLKEAVLDLFGVPSEPKQVRSVFFSGTEVSVEETNLYEISIRSEYPFPGAYGEYPVFYASVEKDGDESILLIGSEPEEVEKARKALKNESGRLKIRRLGPAGHVNFVQANDSDKGVMMEDLLSGLVFKSHAPVFMELSFGLQDKERIEIALRHNLFDVFFGKAVKPQKAISKDEPGLKFGGGHPWLAALFSIVPTEGSVLGLLSLFIGGTDGEIVREFLKEQNISIDTLTKAFRSLGLVLGGDSSLLGQNIPGGYVFISGGADGAESIKTFLPFYREFLNSGYLFEETSREGWDMFYTLKENFNEQFSGIPLFAGMKGGALLLGSLNSGVLDEKPEFAWPAEDGILHARLDVKRLSSLPAALSASWSSDELADAIEGFDLEDLLNANSYSALLRSLAFSQEIREITLDVSDWGSLDLTFITGEADKKQAKDLKRIIGELNKNED